MGRGRWWSTTASIRVMGSRAIRAIVRGSIWRRWRGWGLRRCIGRTGARWRSGCLILARKSSLSNRSRCDRTFLAALDVGEHGAREEQDRENDGEAQRAQHAGFDLPPIVNDAADGGEIDE